MLTHVSITNFSQNKKRIQNFFVILYPLHLIVFKKTFCKIYCKVRRADYGNVFQSTLHSTTEINILM